MVYTLRVVKMVGLVIALRPQTSKHIRDGWSHYTDTRAPSGLVIISGQQVDGPISAL
jgi:hypothetical protein